MIIWQKLVPTVDNKLVALREFLIFNEEIRDKLLDSDPDHITSTTRKLLKAYGQPMIVDALEKFKAGVISEHTYKILEVGTRFADRDADL